MAVLDQIIAFLKEGDSQFGFRGYVQVMQKVCEIAGVESILEVGAGRRPVLLQMSAEARIRYAMNDVSESELELAPDGFEKLVFDISDEHWNGDQQYDLVVSRSVLEHVERVDLALRNTAAMLQPGGLGLHFMPTLFAGPFVANRVLSERTSDKLLSVFAPRDRATRPKFPAYYARCNSTERNRRKLKTLIGDCELNVVPYYDHAYYDRIPIVGQLAGSWHRQLAQWDWRWLSSYCFMVISSPEVA